jgi:hypothetical protein
MTHNREARHVRTRGTICPPPPVTGETRSVRLEQLWSRLAEPTRQRLFQLLSELLTRRQLPPSPKEVTRE